MKRWVYYAKAQSGAAWLTIAVALGAMVALLMAGVYRAPGAGARAEDSYLIFGVLMPLALGLILAPLPALERAAGAAELCLTYRQPASLRLLEQTACATAGWAVLALLTWAVVNFGYADLPLKVGASLVISPALGLGGAALAGGALARSQVGGTLAVAAWWSVDLLQPGVNRLAYLFSRFQPLPGVVPGRMDLHLLLTALLGLGLALWLAGRRSRWIT